MVNLLKMLQATVSHDMISPLNLINMYIGLLENMPRIKTLITSHSKKKKSKDLDAGSLLK